MFFVVVVFVLCGYCGNGVVFVFCGLIFFDVDVFVFCSNKMFGFIL